MERLTLTTLPKYLSDEAAGWQLLERLRWPAGEIVCPHCGVIDSKHYFIAARSGARKTRTGQTSYRRLWRCRHCRKQFSVLVGTIFESSKVPVSKWLLAMWLFNAGKNGVPSVGIAAPPRRRLPDRLVHGPPTARGRYPEAIGNTVVDEGQSAIFPKESQLRAV